MICDKKSFSYDGLELILPLRASGNTIQRYFHETIFLAFHPIASFIK